MMLGLQLHNGTFPRVYNGGVVMPNEAPVVSSALGENKEINNEPEGKRRSATGSRKRTAGRSRASSRPRSSGKATRLGSCDLEAAYEAQMRDLEVAYPGSHIWREEKGMWLLIKSKILNGLERHATFLVAVPYFENHWPRCWAFWSDDNLHEWIGPRHTNFPDGSACAFAAQNNVWMPGGNLIELVDLYTVWVFRHLYYEIHKKWPGPQFANSRLYRLWEFKNDELCSCEHGLTYAQCCKSRDVLQFAQDPKALGAEFLRASGGCNFQDRMPPAAVTEFVNNKTDSLPNISDLFVI